MKRLALFAALVLSISAQSLTITPISPTAHPGDAVALSIYYYPAIAYDGSQAAPIGSLAFKITIFPGGAAELAWASGSGVNGKYVSCAPSVRGLSCIVQGPNENPLPLAQLATVFVRIAPNTLGTARFTVEDIVASPAPNTFSGAGVPVQAGSPAEITVN